MKDIEIIDREEADTQIGARAVTEEGDQGPTGLKSWAMGDHHEGIARRLHVWGGLR